MRMLTTVIILAVFGIVMIAMEVILPGGVLGVFGVLSIGASLVLIAISPELSSIGTDGRLILGGGVILASILLLALWLKFFTRASFVKKHLLDGEIDGTKTYDKYLDLLDQIGIAETDLRPAGKARLSGRKHDVLAETGMIESGTNVRVVKVEGSRVVVRAAS
jgi:membrane-bound serine protease (ClpP class)